MPPGKSCRVRTARSAGKPWSLGIVGRSWGRSLAARDRAQAVLVADEDAAPVDRDHVGLAKVLEDAVDAFPRQADVAAHLAIGEPRLEPDRPAPPRAVLLGVAQQEAGDSGRG